MSGDNNGNGKNNNNGGKKQHNNSNKNNKKNNKSKALFELPNNVSPNILVKADQLRVELKRHEDDLIFWDKQLEVAFEGFFDVKSKNNIIDKFYSLYFFLIGIGVLQENESTDIKPGEDTIFDIKKKMNRMKSQYVLFRERKNQNFLRELDKKVNDLKKEIEIEKAYKQSQNKK